MIRVTDQIVIDANKYGYQLMLDTQKVDKDSKPIYKYLGYYPSLRNAMNGALAYVNRMCVSENDMTLGEAISVFAENQNVFTRLLERVVKEDIGGKNTASDTE